jgi:homoserine dehydrogenase
MDLDPIEELRFIPGDEVESAFYLHLEVADQPGVLAQIAKILGDNQVSVKSVVQKGMGDNARLVMVMHPVAEGRFEAALREISKLALMRSAPRSIRVIEEEFVG